MTVLRFTTMDLKGDEKSSIISTKSLPGRNGMKKLSMLGMVGLALRFCVRPLFHCIGRRRNSLAGLLTLPRLE